MNCFYCGQQIDSAEAQRVTLKRGRTVTVDADCAALGEDYAIEQDRLWCEFNGVDRAR